MKENLVRRSSRDDEGGGQRGPPDPMGSSSGVGEDGESSRVAWPRATWGGGWTTGSSFEVVRIRSARRAAAVLGDDLSGSSGSSGPSRSEVRRMEYRERLLQSLGTIDKPRDCAIDPPRGGESAGGLRHVEFDVTSVKLPQEGRKGGSTIW